MILSERLGRAVDVCIRMGTQPPSAQILLNHPSGSGTAFQILGMPPEFLVVRQLGFRIACRLPPYRNRQNTISLASS
jgi:hypothetical protein